MATPGIFWEVTFVSFSKRSRQAPGLIHCHLPNAVYFIVLEVSKTGLARAWSRLMWWKESLLMAGVELDGL